MVREADAQSPGDGPEGDARVVRRALGGMLVLLAVAVAWAHHAGAGGNTLLGGLGPAIEGATWLGGAMLRSGGAALAFVRVPLLLLAFAWQVVQVRRGEPEPAGRRLLGGFALAAVAHSYCLDGFLAVGFAVFVMALVSLGVAREPADSAPSAPVRHLVPAAFLGAIAVYAVLGVYRLAVYPALFADELAYHEATRMLLGQVERGGSPFWDWKEYTFERFTAQTVPLLLQSVAVAGLGPGLLSIRLASFATVGISLVIAAWVIRRHIDARVASWMLALACVSPLGLIYGRTGFYLAASILHSVATFALVLRFARSGDRKTGAALGALVGGALYFYQLSWFVPILAALALGACAIGPNGARRFLSPWPLAAAALAAVLALAPAPFLLGEGLSDVASQTFDHRSTLRSGTAELLRPQVVVRTRDEIGLHGLAEIRKQLAPHRAKARALVHEGGVTTLRIAGPRERLEGALGAIGGGPWRGLSDTVGAFTAGNYVRRMVARLFYAPGSELGAWIPVPLLNPLVAPLVVLGFASAWRRRGEPVIRALVVWVVGGALIPAAVGGDAARRAVLILPFVHALAALPLVELGAWLRGGAPLRRRVGAAAAALYLIAVGCVGGYQYFRPVRVHWDGAPRATLRPPAHPSMLEQVKVLKGLPGSDPIFLTSIEPGLGGHLAGIEAWPETGALDRISVPAGIRSRATLLAHACAQSPPYRWVLENDDMQPATFAALEEHFETRTDVRGPYRVIHVDSPRPGGCPDSL